MKLVGEMTKTFKRSSRAPVRELVAGLAAGLLVSWLVRTVSHQAWAKELPERLAQLPPAVQELLLLVGLAVVPVIMFGILYSTIKHRLLTFWVSLLTGVIFFEVYLILLSS